MLRGLLLVTALLFGGVSAAQAELDPLTEMALETFRETAAAAPADTTLEHQAKYLMQAKNGLSLYRDNALSAADTKQLSVMIDRQLSAATKALNSEAADRVLAEKMRDSAKQAAALMALEPGSQTFIQQMQSYHSGIGYDAYRYAESKGIEQL